MTRTRMRKLLTLDERSEEEASVMLVMLVCVEVDKIIRIDLSRGGLQVPYIHQVLS